MSRCNRPASLLKAGETQLRDATRFLDQGVLPGAVEVCEASAAAYEFRGGAILNHAAVVHHQDAVGSFNG
ncbi:hypothetical protein AHiyo4_42780 [Arthrobacter sp. Hiyo4]|nr:hypothetical protein AHiyo4_42780 [Arthrobacter sp. Hiyo4]